MINKEIIERKRIHCTECVSSLSSYTWNCVASKKMFWNNEIGGTWHRCGITPIHASLGRSASLTKKLAKGSRIFCAAAAPTIALKIDAPQCLMCGWRARRRFLPAVERRSDLHTRRAGASSVIGCQLITAADDQTQARFRQNYFWHRMNCAHWIYATIFRVSHYAAVSRCHSNHTTFQKEQEKLSLSK